MHARCRANHLRFPPARPDMFQFPENDVLRLSAERRVAGILYADSRPNRNRCPAFAKAQAPISVNPCHRQSQLEIVKRKACFIQVTGNLPGFGVQCWREKQVILLYPGTCDGGRTGTWNALRAASLEPTLACQKRQAKMGHPRRLASIDCQRIIAKSLTIHSKKDQFKIKSNQFKIAICDSVRRVRKY
jgi:hypothetical protein